MNPLEAPDSDFNWYESHHQEHIVGWLREQKEQRRLSFDIGMEGIRLSMGLRAKAKKQGMDSGVPDIKIKLKGGVLIHIELKRWGGSVNDSQKSEHELLKELGHIVYIIKEKTPHKALCAVKKIIEELS